MAFCPVNDWRLVIERSLRNRRLTSARQVGGQQPCREQRATLALFRSMYRVG